MTAETALELGFDGSVFARYRVDGYPRPHLDRLFAGGVPLLRDGLTPIPDDSADHPHHRGVWWGHRAIQHGSSTTDVWTEFAGHGSIFAVEPVSLSKSPQLVEISHDGVWLDAADNPLLAERRRIRAYPLAPDGTQQLDVAGILIAGYGPVVLADTKEAGMVAVRVAPSIEERHGGRIQTATGAVGEAQAWGRSATWCAYAGTVMGVKVGLAVLDHPGNPRYPTCWHVRDYGLLAANPFGYGDFPGFNDTDGALALADGEEVSFQYRLLAFTGELDPELIERHQQNFADNVSHPAKD
jgi:hypothetical protein